MADPTRPVLEISASHLELMFPTLTAAQIARLEKIGTVRQTRLGDVLVEEGAKIVSMYVVKSGRIEVVRPSANGETIVAIHNPGQFSGESNMLSGRRAM